METLFADARAAMGRIDIAINTVGKVLKGSLKDRGVRTDAQTSVGARNGGALTGSIYSKVPVLLVEMCVLTKPSDEKFIRTDAGQKKMAEALFAGMVSGARL